jgi:hypothetical protein
MSARADVIRELQAMFKEGATPSRLIRHIADRHEGDAGLHALIQEYFLEAFSVPIVRGLNPRDDYRATDQHLAFLNELLLNEIVAKRSEWDSERVSAIDGDASWLSTLSARSDDERLVAAQTRIEPELVQSWDQLLPKEQQFIQRTIAGANGLYETVKILARLAECLQGRIVELEEQALEKVGEHA